MNKTHLKQIIKEVLNENSGQALSIDHKQFAYDIINKFNTEWANTGAYSLRDALQQSIAYKLAKEGWNKS